MAKTYATVQGGMVGKHSRRLCKGVSLHGVSRRGGKLRQEVAYEDIYNRTR